MERNYSIDIIKIIAMFGVVCLHTTLQYITPNNFTIADVLFKTAVISIPLFFMTSGYLMLGRKDINYKYVSHKIINIIKFVFTIIFLWWLLHSAKHQTLDFNVLAKTFFGSFIQKGSFSIFWYFGAMVIIYILLPLLNYIYEHNVKVFRFLLITLFVICNIIFICNLQVGGELLVIQTFRVWNWLFYFCLGGYVKHISALRIRPIYIIILILFNLVFQEILVPYIGTELCEYFYSSCVVMALSGALFKYFIDCSIKAGILIKTLSALFLPVYVSHVFIIGYANKLFLRINLGYIESLVFWLFVSFVTVIISYFIIKAPIINKIFRL